MRRRWQSCLSLVMGNQGEKALKLLPPFQFLLECGYKFGTIYPEAWRRTRGGVPYTPCLLMKPVLCLRLHAMQLQSCFPVASNALALPRRQRHFYGNADRAYNTLHFASKVVCQGASPFGNPGQQNRLNISHFPGAWYSAFICCQQPPFRGLRVVPCKLT